MLHAPSARIGGALNYMTAIVPELASAAPDCDFLAVLPARSIAKIPKQANFRVIPVEEMGPLGRLWYDQGVLRRFLKSEKIDVLFSTANTGMVLPPCRQVLLVRNSLYFSRLYKERILPWQPKRFQTSHALRQVLVSSSIRSSHVVMTPSHAMMDEVRRELQFPASKAVVNHYGVDVGRFGNGARRTSNGRLKLVFTGLYSEHKNVGTLFDAMLELQRAEIPCHLITPADPAWEGVSNPIRHQDVLRAQKLRGAGHVSFTGVLSGAEIAGLYREADIFVYPCVIESFGHPLLEAMAAGLPVVAADTPLNRELAGDAAVYFEPYDPQGFASKICQVAESPELRSKLVTAGRERCRQFTWRDHAERLLQAFSGAALKQEEVATEVFQ